jgi:hypothetical protein
MEHNFSLTGISRFFIQGRLDPAGQYMKLGSRPTNSSIHVYKAEYE